MSRRGIAGSYGSSIFRFLRNLHAVIHNVYTSHHSKRLNPRWHFILKKIFFYLLATLHKVQDLKFPDQGLNPQPLHGEVQDLKFPDQGLNPHPLHGQAESSSLDHEGGPEILSPGSAGWSPHYEFRSHTRMGPHQSDLCYPRWFHRLGDK